MNKVGPKSGVEAGQSYSLVGNCLLIVVISLNICIISVIFIYLEVRTCFMLNFCILKKIEDTLGENAELFKNHYYVKSSGNCDLSPMSDPHNEFSCKNVLIERKPASSMASKCGKSLDEYSQILGDCRQKLFDVRSKRPRPHLDDKVLFYMSVTYHFNQATIY